MTNRTERGPVAHAEHDALLIAQYAADDLDVREREAAERLVASCADCAQLATDLLLIARGTAELPAPVRPRDFTLTPEQAGRLRRRGFLGRFGLGWVRTDVGRTLAAGLTTLGLAGLLIGVVPGQFAMSGSAAAPLQTIGKSVDEAAAPAASGAAAGGAGAPPEPSAPRSVAGYPGASAAAASAAPQPAATGSESYGVDITGERPVQSQPDRIAAPPSETTDSGLRDGTPGGGGPNLLILASLGALGLGVGLFALRRVTSTSV
jgi:hypothetical protein